MDQYAVIGNPISHSVSPEIHRLFAAQTKQEMSYIKLLAPLEKFKETVLSFIAQGGKGINVTLPFKQEAYLLAEKKSLEAIEAKAGNTLLFRENGVIELHNTDGIGLITDLTRKGYVLKQKRILIIGCGGAVNNILGSLLRQEPAEVIIANRTQEKAAVLAKRFAAIGHVDTQALDALHDGPFDFIIHSTSVRRSEDASNLVLPGGLVNEKTCCYDLNYQLEADTAFVQWAKTQGVTKVSDGIGMLIEQAAVAFHLWRGIYPNTKPILQQLRACL